MNKGECLVFELVEGLGCLDCAFYAENINCSYKKGVSGSYIKHLKCSHGYIFKFKGVMSDETTEDNCQSETVVTKYSYKNQA